jgi:hypothetical protein
MQSSGQHLITLRGELASRGVHSELQNGGGQLRLRVSSPGQSIDADEPTDAVIVARIGGEWWFCWPQLTPVMPVTTVPRAAEAIISELGLGGAGTAEGAEIEDLAAWRMLRQAREGIFHPYAPDSASPGGAAGGRAPGRLCPAPGTNGRRAGHAGPGGSGLWCGAGGDPLRTVAADLAIAGFEVDVIDRWSDGRPAVLAVTSPATGACAEVTAYGMELELRFHSAPAGAAGLITAQVTAVLTAGEGDDLAGGPLAAAVRRPDARTDERRVLLAHLHAGLAGLGMRASQQPSGQSLEIWPGLYAGVSRDGTRYGWTAEGSVRTHPAGDVDGAARRIAACRDMLAGGAKERSVAWPEVMPPGPALQGLRVELAARGVATIGMTLTRLQGVATLAEGSAVRYRCGWLFWPAGRLSRGGPPLYAVHWAGDPVGAARRLALSIRDARSVSVREAGTELP